MNEDQDKLNRLEERFKLLYNKQRAFIGELNELKEQITELKGKDIQIPIDSTTPKTTEAPSSFSPSSQERLSGERSARPAQKAKRKNVIGGVSTWIASSLNIDPVIIRILWVVLTFFSAGAGILIYAGLWLFLALTDKNKAKQPTRKTSSAYPETNISSTKERPKISANFEKFIGENLISLIGVAITILGIGVGVKYSIENELISPITRIVLGYISGLALLGFGIKLKKNYHNYSAILVSGAIAVLYFITFSAYAFYDLIPQMVAFGMMFLFTVFTVVAAITYNRQVIAHIGLVGAYALPFLLSQGSDDVGILFSYMAIINLGILFISFRKYWKPLYYSAFGMTWAIYLFWYVDGISEDQTKTAFTFLSIFFAIFYLTFLAYKLIKKEKFSIQDISLLLANSAIFYGVGYHLLNGQTNGKELLGLFTLGNALIHFIMSVIIYKQKLSDKNLFYLVSGLVLIFLTIAIPVQLDGNWVTLLWAGQAALLFWIGRTKNVNFYEVLSYPLMILACLSINHDWAFAYNNYVPENLETRITPLLNINFLSALLFIGAFVGIHIVNRKNKLNFEIVDSEKLTKIIAYGTAAIIIITFFSVCQLEIANYFYQIYKDSIISLDNRTYMNYDLLKFREIWVINFTMIFVSVLSFFHLKKTKSKGLGLINLTLICLVGFSFITVGLYTLGGLRESYVEQNLAEYYQRGSFHIIIRYISIILFAIMMSIGFKYVHQSSVKRGYKIAFDVFLHISIISILSSELISWMHIMGHTGSDKIGLSILWGFYSLFLIGVGIYKKKKYLRIGAIVLIALTLAKLFLYDIVHLNTISKTIVLVSLGVLLLLISFLYNKFKPSNDDENVL